MRTWAEPGRWWDQSVGHIVKKATSGIRKGTLAKAFKD